MRAIEITVKISALDDGSYRIETTEDSPTFACGKSLAEAMSRLMTALEQRLLAKVASVEHLEAERPVSGEIYTPARKAEFLLSSAVDAEDYAQAADEVRKLGLYPDAIPHYNPAGS
jgi:hypothetical protein